MTVRSLCTLVFVVAAIAGLSADTASVAVAAAVTGSPHVSPSSNAAQSPTSPRSDRGYPVHTNIVSTTFWVGEIFDPTLPDGSQVCSTYDSQWAFHWSGVNKGTVPAGASGCPGATKGGCDGVSNVSGSMCNTEPRTAANGYFPNSGVRPHENPFYLDLPYDDLNDAVGYTNRCGVIPWANDAGYAGHCTDSSFSYLKNRWVKITGPNGHVCYGQNEDAGPSHGNLYHDASYVFGRHNARPVQTHFNNAGMDVSPALNGCLGYHDLDGENDHVSWRFVDSADVPNGPWKVVVTTSGIFS